jgi:predicted nucleic acid-binding protein
MARPALVLDASVGVKWFSGKAEDNLTQALEIKNAHLSGRLNIVVPDLFFYEVLNALTKKSSLPLNVLRSATAALMDLELNIQHPDKSMNLQSIEMARRHELAVYDSSYISLAKSLKLPLVTANPRHQGKTLECDVIPIEKWKP